MNARDVYREVSAMISEGHMESKGSLRASLNRALSEIGHLYPQKKFVTLRHFGKPSLFRLPQPREVTKESPLTVSAFSCKDIVFRGSGRGEVFLTFGGKHLFSQTLDGLPFSFHKTLSSLDAEGDAELVLVFRSDYGMVLEELVLYDGIYEEKGKTKGNHTIYRMADEFISFSQECYKNGLPMVKGGEVMLEGDCVLIDTNAQGVYEIGCYATPNAVTEKTESEDLDVSAELCYLVPLLTAYYACLEADDARADDFWARYEAAKKDLLNTARFATNDTVEDVRGW